MSRPSAVAGAGFQSLWLLETDPGTLSDLGGLMLADATLGLVNWTELRAALMRLKHATNSRTSDDVPLPEKFPAPQLVLPESEFAPDFFTFSTHCFASRRLREALAQPGDVVQFAPVEILAGGAEVRAQDYRELRVLAHQPAMDLERSECALDDSVDRKTGRSRKVASWIDRFVLLPDLQPRTAVFRVDETWGDVLVTDAVAARVLRAGCTGLQFTDPACPRHGPRIARFRTAEGIGEKRVHMHD